MSHDFLTIFVGLFYDFLMTLSCLSHDLLMTFSWFSHGFPMTFWILSHDFLVTFWWLSHDFLVIFSQFLCDCVMTFSKNVMTLSGLFYDWLQLSCQSVIVLTVLSYLNWQWLVPFYPLFCIFVQYLVYRLWREQIILL